MSDSAPRSAPLVTILTVLVGFALFAVVVHYVYVPHETGPFSGDGIHTAELRTKNLAELRAKHAKQAASYAWVDQKKGIVQLPIDLAMKLTVEKYEARK
ncbi:MAG: hypothetical protein ABI222_02100 [Opitutaceae bacterium]